MTKQSKAKFDDKDDGSVQCNGLILPADMSDELKTLNVQIESSTSDVIFN